MRKRKNYIVTIIAKNYRQEVEVKAESKKDAENMVDNVLLGCEYFVFDDKTSESIRSILAFGNNF